MFFTLYYMTATIFQSWRLKTICTKISKHLSTKASVVFYRVEETDVTATPIFSDLSSNHQEAVIQECLFLNGIKVGCAVVPYQNIFLGPWIKFPMAPNLIPVNHGKGLNTLFDQANELYLLIETATMPSLNNGDGMLMMENYGIPFAWKVDSRIAFLLKTDLKHFSELLVSTFMHDQFLLNDKLPIIRIESVSVDGEPQCYNMLKNHSKKQSLNRLYQKLNKVQWELHINELKQISVLANQATEFEYNKYRTEGKTGVIKPDLISSKNIQKTLFDTKDESPDKEVPLKTIELDRTSSKANTENILESIEKYNTQCSRKSFQETNETFVMTLKPAISLNKSLIQNIPSSSQNTNASQLECQSFCEVASHKIEQDNLFSDQKDINMINKLFCKASTPSNSTITSSVVQSATRPSLKRTEKGGIIEQAKPPNILVYSESNTTKENVISTLRTVLEPNVYTIYPLATNEAKNKVWIDNATVLVVCGNVPKEVGKIFLDYFLHGGKMFCLCSDVLHIILPTYRIAEVREHELVQFTYGRWKQVKMIHHIFCYQPSPIKKQFSSIDEEQPVKAPLQVPRYVDVYDVQGGQHKLSVQVLGTEETWNTPSLILAHNSNSSGLAIFSQIHLEINPLNYEKNDPYYHELIQNEQHRVDILADLLRAHLGLVVANESSRKTISPYTHGYFLGKYEDKVNILSQLKPKMVDNKTAIQNDNILIKFCGIESSDVATESFLPILIHSCPDNFDTVKYFEFLKTQKIGRLVIYSTVLSSSMDVIQNLILSHGFAVIPRRQTKGIGRGQNTWLSPEGCLMFSLQLHISLKSVLGRNISLLQHLIASAVVKAILDFPGYEGLDLRLKWPNDIYANGRTKISGIIINSFVDSSIVICNVGIGINLSNSSPTVCLNDLVKEYNLLHDQKLLDIEYEYLLASIFNEIEELYNRVQTDGLNCLYGIYYKYWLHSEQQVTIIDRQGNEKLSKIIGIDDYGFLVVQLKGQAVTETVHPDGNSFDMLRGLILPKF